MWRSLATMGCPAKPWGRALWVLCIRAVGAEQGVGTVHGALQWAAVTAKNERNAYLAFGKAPSERGGMFVLCVGERSVGLFLSPTAPPHSLGEAGSPENFGTLSLLNLLSVPL